MFFHFLLNFSFIFSFIAPTYIPAFVSSAADPTCFNNCTATYSDTYVCASNVCEDLSNPRETVTAGTQTTLSNIPCRFTTVVAHGCPL